MSSRLTKKQREHLLGLISEGLSTLDINVRAARFNPPYQVSQQGKSYYRKTRKLELPGCRRDLVSEKSAIVRGYARREQRIQALDNLASTMEKELLCTGEDNRLWVGKQKRIGSGEHARLTVEEKFNQPEVKEFRGVLDDIAKEMGERKQKVEHTGKDGGSLKIEVVYAENSIELKEDD